MDTKWNSTGPDEGLEQLVAGEVREALKGVEDAPGVAKVRVSGKTCGTIFSAASAAFVQPSLMAIAAPVM